MVMVDGRHEDYTKRLMAATFAWMKNIPSSSGLSSLPFSMVGLDPTTQTFNVSNG
jgi:hypothetical protein